MKTYEDNCLGCPKEWGCLGGACPYMHMVDYHCDECGDYASYCIDGYDFCEQCAEKYLQDIFNECTIKDKAEILDLSYSEY